MTFGEMIRQGVNTSAQTAGLATTDTPSLSGLIGVGLNTLFGVLGVIFLAYLVLGGILWMIAGSNEEKIGRAKKIVLVSGDGMLVIFLAYVALYFILQALKYATDF